MTALGKADDGAPGAIALSSQSGGAGVASALSAVPEQPERRAFAAPAQRDAAIVELALLGLSPGRIEELVAASRSVIYAALRAARQRGVAIPFFSTSGAPLRGLPATTEAAEAALPEPTRARRIRGVTAELLAEPRPRRTDVAARRAEIQPDTRSLTGRLLGDPMPGRSALDRRREGR